MVNWGAATDRKMLLTSDMAHSPYLDIFTTGETPWEGVTTTTRLGNLLGIYDEDFGGQLSGEGLYSTNAFLKGIIHASGGIIGTGGEGIVLDGINKEIRSGNYVQGTSGWLIDNDGNAEFNQLVFPERPVSYQSLIDNGDFAQWNSSTDASSWTKSGTGNLQQGSGNYAKIGSYSAKVTTSGADGEYTYIYQRIHSERGIEYWRGRTITVGCWMLFSGADDSARLIVRDDIHNASKYHPGDGEWHWLTVTFTVDQSATLIHVYPYIKSTFGSVEAMYVDGVTAVEGEECPFYVNKGISASSGTGLVVNSYRMGFVSNGTWQTYIQNNGSFRFGGNANNYLLWNGTNFSVYTTGLFTVSGGGSIVAQGHDTSPGKIIWQGSSSSIEAYASLGGNYFTMVPTTPYASQFDIGTVDHSFSRFYVKTRTGLELRTERSADEFAYLDTYVSSSISLLSLVSMQGSDSTVLSIYTAAGTRRINLTGHLRTVTNNTYDIGTSSAYFRNIYANNYYYHTAFSMFDIIDDLQALKNIKEKKRYDGTSVLDPIQNIPIIETATLPEQVLAHYEEDVPAETYYAEDGSIIQLRPGKKKGDIIYGDDGEPFVDGSNLMAFLLGSARNLVIYAEGLENRIKELENIMLRDEGKINREG